MESNIGTNIGKNIGIKNGIEYWNKYWNKNGILKMETNLYSYTEKTKSENQAGL